MEILYQSGVDRMDIPRGEIMLESPLEFVDLRGVLQKFTDKGYLEVLLTGDEIEEGYVFIEKGKIIGVFYEGSRKGDPSQNIQELLHEKPAIILHKLTETQLDVLKEVYPLDKNYGIDEIFEGKETAKPKEEVRHEPAAAEPTAPTRETVERAVPKEWLENIPLFSKGISIVDTEREEVLEDLEPFVRNVLKYVDGKRTIREIIELTGESPEDIIGIIEPYRKTGHIKFKK